jgi:aryl-alcohol dehydrogenase-like predicted oxidoreductase
MAKLVNENNIQYVGVSNFSASQMRKAYHELAKFGYTLASNQVQYSLLQRKIEKNQVLETAKELGVAIIAYSPLAQGILTGKYHDNPEDIKTKKGFRKRMGGFRESSLKETQPLINKLKEIAEEHYASPAQIALNWLVNYHGNHVFAIPGASSTKQAESNAKAMQIQLSNDEMDALNEESWKIQ